MSKGFPPRNEQEMEEAKALMALCEAYVDNPTGTDAIDAARVRIARKEN
jgi:hypothetical protein